MVASMAYPSTQEAQNCLTYSLQIEVSCIAKQLWRIAPKFENYLGTKQAARQKVNLNKSTIYFIKSCDDGTKEALKNFLGVTLSWEDDKYLGLALVTHSLNGKPFNTLRSEFGKGFKVGRVASYLKLARKSSVAQMCWPML